MNKPAPPPMEHITRHRAAALGLKRFYEGTICLKGHNSPRYVSTGACIACQREQQRRYQAQILRRDIRVAIPVPSNLSFDDEDRLHKIVYDFGVAQAKEMADANPMHRATALSHDLQVTLATGAERALHPGGFRAPKVNEEKPYLSVKTVMYDANGQPIPSAPRARPAAPPQPPAAPSAPPAPPAPPTHVVAPPMPSQMQPTVVDDIEPSEAELMAEFERLMT